mmetsp:Transcript_17157/g.47270  ORF Transcript_17157/g.47270 Transcript_17157/m.47270 type:complete len:135 (+) Transcript_17157:31-435(+)
MAILSADLLTISSYLPAEPSSRHSSRTGRPPKSAAGPTVSLALSDRHCTSSHEQHPQELVGPARWLHAAAAAQEVHAGAAPSEPHRSRSSPQATPTAAAGLRAHAGHGETGQHAAEVGPRIHARECKARDHRDD